MSKISSQDFQHASLAKLSRWTVTRAEVFAAGSLLAAHRSRMQDDAPDLSHLTTARALGTKFVIDWSGGSDVISKVSFDDVSSLKFTCVT